MKMGIGDDPYLVSRRALHESLVLSLSNESISSDMTAW